MPVLYDVYDGGEDHGQTFRSFRAARKAAQEIADYSQREQAVDRIYIPQPTLALVLSIINETGYVTKRDSAVYVAKPRKSKAPPEESDYLP